MMPYTKGELEKLFGDVRTRMQVVDTSQGVLPAFDKCVAQVIEERTNSFGCRYCLKFFYTKGGRTRHEIAKHGSQAI